MSSGLSGFTLRGTLGTPQDAAETLLSKSIAPEGSRRTATLIRSIEVTKQLKQQQRQQQKESSSTIAIPYYQFEYIVDRGRRGPPLQNIAVVAASPKGDKLYTLTVVAPVEKWTNDVAYETKLRKIADS